jgi:hypothetical protein
LKKNNWLIVKERTQVMLLIWLTRNLLLWMMLLFLS